MPPLSADIINFPQCYRILKITVLTYGVQKIPLYQIVGLINTYNLTYLEFRSNYKAVISAKIRMPVAEISCVSWQEYGQNVEINNPVKVYADMRSAA